MFLASDAGVREGWYGDATTDAPPKPKKYLIFRKKGSQLEVSILIF
jgi:hypothetical protein